MWNALQNNWKPPKYITKEKYDLMKSKKHKSHNANMAFIGFGCSFGCIYFCSYKYEESRHDLTNQRNIMLNKAEKLKDVHFVCTEYSQFNNIKNCIIYCDPPYVNGNTHYKQSDGSQKFDSDEFYKWCEKMAVENLVFVSEFKKPKNIKSKKILELEGINGNGGSILKNECLYLILPNES